MNAPAEPGRYLDELSQFFAALFARERFGDHICLAAQPTTPHGSPDAIVSSAVQAGAEITARWADELVAAVGGHDSEVEILTAMQDAQRRFDVDAFARATQQEILRGVMLGSLDADWEIAAGESVPVETFAATQDQPFAQVPFADAVKLFEQRKILPPKAFYALEDGAKRKAFTVSRLASDELLGAAHAELLRMIRESKDRTYKDPATGKWVYKGPNFREFDRFAKEKLQSAGWTPANPSHVETIYRTNVMSAYSSGRVAHGMQPAIAAALPYWEIVTVRDDRQRASHRKAHGIVLLKSDQFWLRAFPPFGFNCRCRCCSRSKLWFQKAGKQLGPAPADLPDPGFDSGVSTLIQVPKETYVEPPKPAPKAPPVAPPPPPPPKPIPLPPVDVPLPPPPPPVHAPLPPVPPGQKPPTASVENVLAQKLEDAKGTNAGGVYLGADGVKRYVKLYKDPAQAAGEHLANQIYADLGLGRVKSLVVPHGATSVYASEILSNVKTLGQVTLDKKLASKALEGFAADVLTANWDAAGLSLDNMVVDAKGKLYRIDNGGAFLMRAKQGRKPASALGNPSEWEKLLKSTVNPGYGKLAKAAGVQSAEDLGPALKRQIEKIVKLRTKAGGWRAYVDRHNVGLSPGDREQIIAMLDARTQFLEAKLQQLSVVPKPLPAPVGGQTFEQLPLQKFATQGVALRAGTDPDAYRKAAAKRVKTLAQDERAAVVNYTGSAYGKIRDTLRLSEPEWVTKHGGGVSQYQFFRGQALAIQRGFDRLAATVAESPDRHVAELYRGIRNVKREVVDQLLGATEFYWRAPTSTSLQTSTALAFSTMSGKADRYAVIFRLKLSQDAAAVAQRVNVESISQLPGEREVLMARGGRFRITGVSRSSHQPNTLLVEAEEIAPGTSGLELSRRSPRPRLGLW